MKKLLFALMGLVLLLGGCTSSPSKETLRVYNWGVYIDESVISEFEEMYDVRVIYENFESNEMMYTQLQSGEVYDVVVPSDYMIERMIKEGMLQQLDKSLLPNLDGIMEHLKSLPHDPTDSYSAPYFWGNIGLLYNINNVDELDLISQGWNILQNTKYAGKIFVYDSERDTFMVALKALGYSANTSNAAELTAAYEWLIKVNNTMSPVYVTDEVIDQMINGTKDIAIMYSGDAVYVEMENEDMAYYVPNQGTNIWVDAMVIPANAKNVDLAHKWIDFMLDYEVALANTYEVAYTTPIQEVFDLVTSDGEEFADYLDSYVPRLNYELDETFRHNEETKRIMSDLWIRVKAQ
jgi:spermidine/putrescine transport system substrate-binding protein/spermidine/putrescine transport system permease protein